MKCHWVAWGHPTKPDIDAVSEKMPPHFKEYPYQSTALLEAISYSAIKRALYEQDKKS